MIRTTLTGVAVAGLLVTGWAFAGEHCQHATAAKSQGGGCGAGARLSAEATQTLNENAAYKHANELLKSWSEAPAKLVAMTDDDRAALASAAQKMSGHPTAAVMHPSVDYVLTSLRTLARMDAKAQEMASGQCKAKTGAAGASASAGEAPRMCPKVKAATLRMEQSAGLVLKARELITVAVSTGGECGSRVGAMAKAMAEHQGGCPTARAEALRAAATQPAIALVKSESEPIGVKAVKAGGETSCPKTMAANAEALINESGKILAQWQDSGVVLASMDEETRSSLNAACAGAMSHCPAGRLMPDTLSTARDLLVEAARLNAQCRAECAKNPEKTQASTELKPLMQARTLLISAVINVLDRTSSIAKPAKQMASAQ